MEELIVRAKIDLIARELEFLFLKANLGAAGQLVYYDKVQGCFILAVHSAGWDAVGLIAEKALATLQSTKYADLPFAVQPLHGKRTRGSRQASNNSPC